MDKEYSGRIRLNMLINSTESLAQFRIQSIDIPVEWFIQNVEEEYFYYDFAGDYDDVVFLNAYRQDTQEEVLVDVMYLSTSRLRIRTLDATPLTIYFICRGNTDTKYEESQSVFYPQTKTDMVMFKDGTTLEDMYQNNLLYRNSHQDEAEKWRYCKIVDEHTFIENRGSYILEISPDEHKLGDSITVTDVLRTDTDGYTTDNKNNVTIRIAENGTVQISSGINFIGYIIIEKKGWR